MNFAEAHFILPDKAVKNRMRLFLNKQKDCESCQACQNVIFNAQLKSSPNYQKNAQLCKDYKANADYKNVEFDPYSGGMKAIHIGHNFDKIKGKPPVNDVFQGSRE